LFLRLVLVVQSWPHALVRGLELVVVLERAQAQALVVQW
jgi:hypothetical protein